MRKIPETKPKSPRTENGRTTAPPPQAEIGGAKTLSRDRDRRKHPAQAEINLKTPKEKKKNPKFLGKNH